MRQLQEAYAPEDFREGTPMELGARTTPKAVAELEEQVDEMVSGLEKKVPVLLCILCARFPL
jgi:hypothetical protein